MDSFALIILASAIVIVSYFFNIFSNKTKIPTVLMLIGLGLLIKQVMEFSGYTMPRVLRVLEILGNVGLIMIVLEAALDLELSRKKWPLIWKSFSTAFLCLFACAFVISFIIGYFIPTDPINSLIYAIPLSIMSSAIIIPSVGNLAPHNKEYMVYESTFSDILGIMFFYFLIGNVDAPNAQTVIFDVFGNILITVLLSVTISYALVLVFQKIRTQVKLFLLIAVLMMLYSVGKLFHLSSLIIILIFGLVINNHQLFFRGFLKKYIQIPSVNEILHNFHLITMETAFVVRTFFFVIFGLSISLASLYDLKNTIISTLIVLSLYLVRYVFLKLFLGKGISTLVMIAPRGLITILLFYAIPVEHKIEGFSESILLFVILSTSIIMSISLMSSSKEEINVNPDPEESDELTEPAILREETPMSDGDTKLEAE